MFLRVDGQMRIELPAGARFIAGQSVAGEPSTGQARLRAAAEVIAGAAVAWRMPDMSVPCTTP
jgi:hypothetical protein